MKNRIRHPARCGLWLGLALLMLAGCGGHSVEVRGQPPSGPAVSVAKLASAHGTVTVHGRMVEK